MSILAISKQYRKLPSEIIGLKNDYESFCFNEACTYIMAEMSKEDGRPKFIDDESRNKTNNNDVIEWLNTNNKF